jgi:integrase
MQLLTDAIIRRLAAPETGLVIYRDAKVRGLGVRVLPSGSKAFVLDYTTGGRRRIYTIGKIATGDKPGWTLAAAREHAMTLQVQIRNDGADPADQLKQAREAETVEELCENFIEVELPKLRASTQRDYRRMIANDIKPAIGKLKVVNVQSKDIQKLHAAITKRGSPVAANGCVVLCKHLFNIAKVKDNPAKGIKPNPVQGRERYLKEDEIGRFTEALDSYDDQIVADIFRLLMLTGARRGETQAATWDQFDLTAEAGVWTKPGHATKQKRVHRVPLSPPALAMLTKRRANADTEIKKLENEIAQTNAADRAALQERKRRVETYVFPARDGSRGHIWEIKKAWASLCKTAKIKGARAHDLRHTAASTLASAGISLVMIGKLLGHSSTTTTQRYAHLLEDAQRATADLLGAAISKAGKGKRPKSHHPKAP